jgi:hypothetical protein
MDRTSELDAKQWLFSMINSLKQDDLNHCLVTLWAIWFARRQAIHEGKFQSPLSTHAFVESFFHDLELARGRPCRQQPQQSNTEAQKWIAPPRGYAKINVDAAVRKQGRIGALAAVCRSDDGLFLGASTIVLRGIVDPTILEALACREALALALDL